MHYGYNQPATDTNSASHRPPLAALVCQFVQESDGAVFDRVHVSTFFFLRRRFYLLENFNTGHRYMAPSQTHQQLAETLRLLDFDLPAPYQVTNASALMYNVLWHLFNQLDAETAKEVGSIFALDRVTSRHAQIVAIWQLLSSSRKQSRTRLQTASIQMAGRAEEGRPARSTRRGHSQELPGRMPR